LEFAGDKVTSQTKKAGWQWGAADLIKSVSAASEPGIQGSLSQMEKVAALIVSSGNSESSNPGIVYWSSNKGEKEKWAKGP